MSPAAWIAVGLLGGVASAARFALDAEIAARARSPFPLGIFVVNVSGALLIGLVAGAGLDGEALVIVAGGGIPALTPPFRPGSSTRTASGRPIRPASPGSTSASPSPPALPPSPLATGSAAFCKGFGKGVRTA